MVLQKQLLAESIARLKAERMLRESEQVRIDQQRQYESEMMLWRIVVIGILFCIATVWCSERVHGGKKSWHLTNVVYLRDRRRKRIDSDRRQGRDSLITGC